MPTASYIKIPAANEDLVKAISVGTDQWAIALTNTAPISKTFTAGTTDLATGNGYTAGGNNVATSSSAMVGSSLVLILANPATWTASGTGFTFRYALLVDKTTNIIPGYWDYGSSQAVASGETVNIALDATNGVFSVT